jgi:conjugal transfer pilus assembly protein TraB
MSLKKQLTKILQDIKSKWASQNEGKLSRFFKPEGGNRTRRLQIFWACCLGIFAIIAAILIAQTFFEKEIPNVKKETTKPQPTSIETTTNKVNMDEIWRHKMEEEFTKFREDMEALKTLFQAQLTDKSDQDFAVPSSNLQDIEEKLSQIESRLENKNESGVPELNAPFAPSSQPLSGETGNLIQRFSLGLTDNHKRTLKTAETTIPAGAFAKTILLSGIDASSAMTASSDPRPMLLRLVDHGTLPRRFQSDIMDCHCIAGAYGDLSSERVYARLETLTCVDNKTNEIYETKVSGYIAGGDGKAGIRGIVVSKDGEFLSRSLVGGMFAGLSNMANPQNNKAQTPFFVATPSGQAISGTAQAAKPIGTTMLENFGSGMSQGISTALDRLSQYYIDRAEQLQPVIQVAAGQVVDVVFTESAELHPSDEHFDINHQKGNKNDKQNQ